MRHALMLLILAVPVAAAEPSQPLVAPPAAQALPGTAASGAPLTSPWLTDGWDDGLAEVAEYDLRQFRYGELHPGSAVLVAVREAADPQRLVKSATPNAAAIPVLKLHWTRTFQTGVYRYDQSSFQLVRQVDGLPLRWLITSHEWCGTAAKSWVNGGPLRVTSYFDGHGDLEQPLVLQSTTVLTDSLWWWVRAWLAAGATPRPLTVIPSQIEARCVATTARPATLATRATNVQGQPATEVTVHYDNLTEVLTVANDQRRTVLAWTQADGSLLTLRQVRRFAYWAAHGIADRP